MGQRADGVQKSVYQDFPQLAVGPDKVGIEQVCDRLLRNRWLCLS